MASAGPAVGNAINAARAYGVDLGTPPPPPARPFAEDVEVTAPDQAPPSPLCKPAKPASQREDIVEEHNSIAEFQRTSEHLRGLWAGGFCETGSLVVEVEDRADAMAAKALTMAIYGRAGLG